MFGCGGEGWGGGKLTKILTFDRCYFCAKRGIGLSGRLLFRLMYPVVKRCNSYPGRLILIGRHGLYAYKIDVIRRPIFFWVEECVYLCRRISPEDSSWKQGIFRKYSPTFREYFFKNSELLLKTGALLRVLIVFATKSDKKKIYTHYCRIKSFFVLFGILNYLNSTFCTQMAK